ncbi:PIR protein [Plasmodium yoelii yoelii]|uniref:PIR protein n=1 Tax=Plasmodium yoelii yoelii TaxID=73239 RepID=A0AAF0B2Z4_PLAYO|nr:PIR protein [Plasmodium yoelii yoelii]
MNKTMCKKFQDVRNAISDELGDNKTYQFKDNIFLNNYCDNVDFSSSFCNNNFQSDFDKISAGCVYLLDEFIKECGVDPSLAKNNINIVDYILIWLSYMINLKYSEEENIITCFYSAYIHECDKYKKKIDKLTDYKDYKDIIDKKWYLLNMDSNNASKFYKAFKLLCEMYTDFDEKKKDCTNYSEKANEFVKQYEELYEEYNSTNDSSYKQVLCTLSTDYDNLIKKCNDTQCCKSSSLPTIETEKIPGFRV